ncbi:MAG TPA: preprotein translocase subunit YajC [Acidimicrobiales bacterium]|jgi:preprotein translocase subunit YajC|nr:preprotein translocase subunit YajC [Acidimicrobiales bacterium]
MHFHLLITHLLGQVTTTTKPGSGKKSSSSYVPLIFLVVIFALVYFLFLRPRQQRMRQQQSAARELGVGDEVMSAGGIYGRVVAIDSNEVEVEVAPGVVLTFLRRAVSARQAPGGATGRGASAPEPVDEPWETDPDGPGDHADPPAFGRPGSEPEGGPGGEGSGGPPPPSGV